MILVSDSFESLTRPGLVRWLSRFMIVSPDSRWCYRTCSSQCTIFYDHFKLLIVLSQISNCSDLDATHFVRSIIDISFVQLHHSSYLMFGSRSILTDQTCVAIADQNISIRLLLLAHPAGSLTLRILVGSLEQKIYNGRSST